MPRHPDPARLPQRRRPRRTRTREILLRAPFSLVLFGLRFRLRHLALPAFGLELRGGVAALLAQAAAFGRGCDEDGAVQDLAFAGHRPSPRSCLTAATPGYSNHDPARPCAFPARAGAPGEEYEVSSSGPPRRPPDCGAMVVSRRSRPNSRCAGGTGRAWVADC